jgi:uncharacterized protein YegP (UPF0339 family)
LQDIAQELGYESKSSAGNAVWTCKKNLINIITQLRRTLD